MQTYWICSICGAYIQAGEEHDCPGMKIFDHVGMERPAAVVPPKARPLYLWPEPLNVFVVSVEIDYQDTVIGVGTSYINALRIAASHRRMLLNLGCLFTRRSRTAKNRFDYWADDQLSRRRLVYTIDENPVNRRW